MRPAGIWPGRSVRACGSSSRGEAHRGAHTAGHRRRALAGESCAHGSPFLRSEAVRFVLAKLTLLASLAALVLAGKPARADGLSVPETERLLRGETIVRTQTLDRGGRHYVGGVSYAMVEADAD